MYLFPITDIRMPSFMKL